MARDRDRRRRRDRDKRPRRDRDKRRIREGHVPTVGRGGHPGKGGTAGDHDRDTATSGASWTGGEPGMDTSATTTAPASQTDTSADQADSDMEAFFSSGHGAAQHYDVVPNAGVGQENPSTVGAG